LPAREALEQALAQQRRLAGPDDPESLETLQVLGEVSHLAGDDKRARDLLEESLARHRRVHGERDARTARVLYALAPVVAAQDLDRAGELLRRSLEIRRAALGPTHAEVAESLAGLGGYHIRRSEYAAAREYYRQALDVYPRREDRRNVGAVTIMADYATLLGHLNDHAGAEALQREAIALGRGVAGEQSLLVANLVNNLATTQTTLGRYREAEATFREAFESHRALVGEGHWRTRNVARNVARSLALQRRHGEALPWMDRALAEPVAGAFASAPGLWGIRVQRAQILFRAGRRADAVAEVKKAVGALQGLPSADAARPLAFARVALGRMLSDTGRPAEAEPLLAAARDWLERLGPAHPQHAEAACELARARVLQGGGATELERVRQCLPALRGWGLLEREAIDTLDQLLRRSR
jgi:tetratricopeptide (TPR) repeat protein